MKRRATNKVLSWLLTITVVISTLGFIPPVKVQAAEAVSVSYQTHVQDYGWQNWQSDGRISGTSGQSKRLEGINICVTGEGLGIRYTTHCQDYGWLPWTSNGEMSGTEGESRRLEAIKIELTGANAQNYDVYYRVHAQDYGWLNWAKNGQAAGTAGFSKRLEAIQIRIISRGTGISNEWAEVISNCDRPYYAADGAMDVNVPGNAIMYVSYKTHVQDYGWQNWQSNGAISGTSGESKRLEAINLKLSNRPYSGDIYYQTHVQDYGWQGWKCNGQMAGTSGESKRLEAIRIYLTGDMESHYDVYYRVHAQDYGWLGWVSNGQAAGTSGYSKRLEAIQVVLVAKGSGNPGNVGNIVSNTGMGYISATETNQSSESTSSGSAGSSDIGSDQSAAQYTYELIPLLAPFNSYFFVKTNNPDPSNIRFADVNSKYADFPYTACLVPTSERFADVQYVNKSTGQVNGGYIFEAHEYSSDGGQYVLQQLDRTYNYRNTPITVTCAELMTADDYLVKNYTDASKGFFENLNSVQSALHELSVYPKNILDTSNPSTIYPYPLLAVSPYPELDLNDHYAMYQSSSEELFAEYLHPYVLSSLGFPGMMARVAYDLDPNCTVESGITHYLVDVTMNGETHTYGGAGNGSTDPIYTRYIEKLFLFNGAGNDYATNATMDNLSDKIFAYSKQTSQELETYRDMISGDTFRNTVGNGSWLRVGIEGSDESTYTYVSAYLGTTSDIYNYDYDYALEDVWVDGRYVNEWNMIDLEATYADHPNADVLIRNMTFTNALGQTVTQDVLYEYDSEDDTWYATRSYNGSYFWGYGDKEATPDNMKLTRAQVINMKVDQNATKLPESGLIYDGTVYPGTPFQN